jgi:hypothetical protein
MKVCNGFYIWKWGFNLNEAGTLSKYLPFTMAVNLYNLRLFLMIYIPWLRYARFNYQPLREWKLVWKPIINIVIKRKLPYEKVYR